MCLGLNIRVFKSTPLYEVIHICVFQCTPCKLGTEDTQPWRSLSEDAFSWACFDFTLDLGLQYGVSYDSRYSFNICS